MRRKLGQSLFGTDHEPLVIGRYELTDRIGGGAMGLVYRALDRDLGRAVAIKLLRPELGRLGGQGQLAAEARALAKLNHPNVVAVYDVGEWNDQRFIAMELVTGGTLRQWQERADRTLSELLKVYVMAGEGLAAAHGRGLVHRDFKPENVLVGEDERPRVLDFGLARACAVVDENTGPAMIPEGSCATATVLSVDGALIGTPAYMAPEQHLGEETDARTDQFSFCVALYEAVHGARPFAGDDLRTLSLSIVRGELSTGHTTAEVPEWLDQILRRGLHVSPDRRFRSMQELLAAVRAQRILDPATATRTMAVASERAGESAGSPGLSSSLAAISAGDPDAPSRRRGEDTFAGLTASLISTVEHTSPLGETSLDLVEIELRHLLGKGSVTRLGRGLSWIGRRYSARLSPTRTGAELLLERNVSLLAKRQALLGLAVGGLGGFILFVACMESIEFLGDVEPLAFILFLTLVGLLGRTGVRLARRLHEGSMDRYRQRLDYIAGRLSKASEEGALARTI